MRLPWYLDFFTYYLRCRVLNKKSPILAGFKITGRCNLNCIHCPFWERPAPLPLTFSQIQALLLELYRQGVRILILEGGEPFLWKDGEHTIHDVVEMARSLFLSVGITTNGTFPLRTNANTIWVSIDGLRDTHNRIRDNSFDKAMEHIKSSNHPNVFANITINKMNAAEIPDLVTFLKGTVKGITIQFHYPYEKDDTLALSFAERREVLDNLIRLKNKGYPLADSCRALEALKSNSWQCQDWMLANVEPDGTINLGCYVKGRGDIQCARCGFAAHTEISLAYGWHVPSILAGRRIFRYGKQRVQGSGCRV
jgi:MoaA/NifB/PqqE/SkfB family radical SAM enzyme